MTGRDPPKQPTVFDRLKPLYAALSMSNVVANVISSTLIFIPLRDWVDAI